VYSIANELWMNTTCILSIGRWHYLGSREENFATSYCTLISVVLSLWILHNNIPWGTSSWSLSYHAKAGVGWARSHNMQPSRAAFSNRVLSYV